MNVTDLHALERQHPALYSAIDTGALERYRTDAMIEGDAAMIAALEKCSVEFPDGSIKQLLG